MRNRRLDGNLQTPLFAGAITAIADAFVENITVFTEKWQKTGCETLSGGVLKCMLINEGQTKSNGDTVYLSCASSNYRLLSLLPGAEYKAKRQIRQK